MARLAQVIKKLNIGLSTAVEFLNKKGEQLENNPNTKLTDEQEALLVKEFSTAETVKLEADRLNHLRQEKEKVVEEAPVVEKVEEVKIEIERPHFKPVAKIDLDSIGKPKAKAEEPKVEEVVAPKPAPVEPKPAPVVVVPEPVKEKVVITPKPVEVKQPEVVKPEPVEVPTTPSNDVFTLRKVEVENHIKMVGKIDLDAINNSTRPAKKSKEEKRKERIDKERVEFQKKKPIVKAPITDAATVVPKKSNMPNLVLKADLNSEDAKKKRKRIGGNERIEINKSVYATTNNNAGGAGNNKKFVKRSPHVAEVNEEDVAKQVKETLARLTQGKKGNKKSAEYRKNKREMNLQRIQDQADAERQAESILKLTEFVTANELATMMNVPVTQVIQTCFNLGLFVSINQRLDAETINIVADEFGFKTEFVSADVVNAISEVEDKEEELQPRSPIVTVMGHVDHGKTSLLDYIRKANVIAGEAGGITQHIGAYNVKLDDGRRITFLDTPGHEAFTAMRARGAKVTDIAIIIVAADDGIMPQTIEAINHASAAGVPIVFAINKVDKPNANPDKIKEALAAMNYLVEEWGGKYQSQDISAKKGDGVKELLEKVLLEAELLDLKANPNRKATGSVIESTLDKGRGYVATVLVSNGTLHMGDVVLAGTAHGRIKAMFNERNQRIKEAKPAEPVIILGLNGAPQAGDNFNVFDQDHEARDIATRREQLAREQGLRTSKHLTLEELGRRRALGDFHELNVIVKGDVDGSIEALSDALIKLSTEEIQVNVIHKAVGQISESDIMLAAASNAIIIGFQVRPSSDARRLAEREEVDIRLYSIIYDAIEELKDAMEGLLSPDIKEEITATLEIRETFNITKVGTIAGCIVKEGKIKRNNKIRLIRDGIVVYTGQLASLKRMKDDVKEVGNGFECGLNIANYNDIKVGDIIESYEEVEVKKSL
ncbi:MAG: translation initiation factor IF-2 [Prevotellaceae bacterium]|nr:translation initiation factor IF-2 [Prevotellaceae bacterium]